MKYLSYAEPLTGRRIYYEDGDHSVRITPLGVPFYDADGSGPHHCGKVIDRRSESKKTVSYLCAVAAGEAEVEHDGPPTLTGAAFHTYEDVLNAPPVAFAIADFLQQDAITLFGGPPAAMKTYCALSVAKSLLSGEPLFDHFEVNAKAKQVIYLSPESALGPFSERIKKLNLLPYVLDGSFLFSTISAVEPIRNLRDDRLIQRIAGADVFLDTVVRFAEGDENSAEAQRVFADNLFWLLKQGARTIIGLHHAPKAFSGASAMTLDNVLRGSGDIGAMAATVWGLSKIDDENSQIYVKCVKDRDFRETPQPFLIEGRPHLDERGKFKMIQTPGSAKAYSSYKQQERGKRGGRPKAEELSIDEVIIARQGLANGRTQDAVAKDLNLSARTLGRMLQNAPTLEQIQRMNIPAADLEHTFGKSAKQVGTQAA